MITSFSRRDCYSIRMALPTFAHAARLSSRQSFNYSLVNSRISAHLFHSSANFLDATNTNKVRNKA